MYHTLFVALMFLVLCSHRVSLSIFALTAYACFMYLRIELGAQVVAAIVMSALAHALFFHYLLFTRILLPSNQQEAHIQHLANLLREANIYLDELNQQNEMLRSRVEELQQRPDLSVGNPTALTLRQPMVLRSGRVV